jgi:excisionase family DNA binding protein
MPKHYTNPRKKEITKLLYSKKEIAQMLNVSLRTIDNLVAYKELLVRRIGRRVLIPKAAISNFLATDHGTQKAT